MNAKALEQIQTRVEAGEPLTEAEVRLLEEAALSEPGPRWRLVIAHALINSDRADSALPLLEALVRDAPNHPQSRLGLARALIALDKYGDAERVLRQVLAQRPADPEAMKGLSLLALRRGETELARKLVKDALELDPFDQEAQLIAAEIDPASGTTEDIAQPPVSIASERAFVDALLVELRAQKVPHRRQGPHLFVKSAGRIGRVDVRGLYEGYVAETRPVGDVARDIARQLGASSDEALTKDELVAKVRPVLRGADFSERAVGALSREISPQLRLFCVLDDPELVRYVPASLAAQHGFTGEELHDVAMKNLAARPVEVKRVRLDGPSVHLTGAGSELVAVWEADGYDGARLLLPEVREALFAALDTTSMVVSFGRRELVLAGSESQIGTLRGLAPRDGIDGLFRLAADGEIVRIS